MLFDMPFPYRILILLLAIVFLILFDFRKPPEKRSRLGEYTFLLLMGVAGALFGALTDWLTSSLSPEYFIYGKGLPPGPDLKRQAIYYGAQAGFGAGAVGAVLFLWFCGTRCPTSSKYWLACIHLSAALGMGTLFGACRALAGWPQPFGNLEGMLSLKAADRFHIVWFTHLGIYSGALLSLLVVIAAMRRRTATN